MKLIFIAKHSYSGNDDLMRKQLTLRHNKTR